jgi:RND family efflux transporter MFP subunit
VISEKQFLESKANYLADSLHFYNFAAGASPEGLKVFATGSGYIHELNVSEGQFVELGQLLVTISSNKVLLLRADVPQQYFFLLDKIEGANFRPAYTDHTYAVEDLEGKLLAKGSSVAENDHYMPVFFEVKNDGSLLEGAFAEFYLKTSEKSNSLAVPVESISEEQSYHYLYIQVTGESFTKRAVTMGENNGKSVEILSGLNPGERVVTEGVMLLKAASMVSGTASHGHAH